MNQAAAQKKCINCGADFAIHEKDRKLLEKMKIYGKYEIPDPVECWDCRQQRRQAQRNERNLYSDECDKCGKKILSIISPDKNALTYCPQCWWGDLDLFEYGMDFDFSRPFFEQWKELYHRVPRVSLIVLGTMENSEYAHDAYRLKNCYLVFDGEQAHDCMYGETFYQLKDCMDFLVVHQSELGYEIVNCMNCYNVKFCRFCNNCSESAFLVDCVGCRNCFACCNLSRSEYCIFNKQYEQSEYNQKIAEYNTGSYEFLVRFKEEFDKFVAMQPKRAYRGVKNEDSAGDNIDNCKDCYYCFDSVGCRDCRYCTNMVIGGNDCMDVDIWGDNLSLAYNSECVGAGASNVMCDYYVGRNTGNVFYSAFCWDGSYDLFGCFGLRHKRHCILNKQYSEKEYFDLFGRIVEHMRGTGEWGQFFPVGSSWFGYNETVAGEFYPLTREEALAKGYKWKEKDSHEFLKQKYVVPDRIEDVPDSVCDEVLACGAGAGDEAGCGRNFKIVPQELAFLRRFNVPIPRKCYNCRHVERRRLKNPRRLFESKCAKTGVSILTPYAPGGPEVVLSAEEYVKEFF